MENPKGVWEQGIASEGLYYAYFNVSRPTEIISNDRVRGFYVFNENVEIVDSFLDESGFTSLVIRNSFFQLKNKNFVFQRRPISSESNSKYEVICVSKEGQEIWKVNDPLDSQYFLEGLYDILPTSDGNLIIYGWREWLFEFEGDPEVFNEYDRFLCGNMVKVNGETGEVMWERIMVDFDENQNVKETYILDLIELSDNSLMGFGIYEINDSSGDYIISDSWMFRVSENGCIDDDHCSFDSFLSSAKEIENNNKSFSVYPNPVTNQMQLNFEVANNNTASIYSANGKFMDSFSLLKDANNVEVDLSDYLKGMYYLIIRDELNEGLLYFEKLIKL